jgi:hypothetical protein
MVPEFVPNFLATLSHPPWTREIRWGLRVTLHGEERVPYSSYIQHPSVTFSTRDPVASFTHFRLLPAELQIQILSFCSPCMLFQIMQVSSALRLKASKLFWAHPEAYFQVPATWLLTGAYPGCTFSDLFFLRYTENVLVECDAAAEDQIGPTHDEVVVVQQDRITTFWNSLIKRCPNAKRVIINSCWAPCRPNTETLPVSRVWDMLIRHAPSQTETFAFVVEEVIKNSSAPPSTLLSPKQEWQRSLYQPLACGSWRHVQSERSWKTILPPTKLFNGPVGHYMELHHKSEVVQQQQDGLWFLMVEALDRHHFYKGAKKPFLCPSITCSAYFKQAGEWSIHAAEVHYNEWITGNRFSILPVEVKTEFEQQERALQEQATQIRQSARRIQDSWNGQDRAGQKELERCWIAQFENDSTWDTGTMPRASRLWIEFVQQMKEAKARTEREHS